MQKLAKKSPTNELLNSYNWQLNNDIARLETLPLSVRRVMILNWFADTRNNDTGYDLVKGQSVVELMQACEPIEMIKYFVSTANPKQGGISGVFAGIDCYINTYTKLQ